MKGEAKNLTVTIPYKVKLEDWFALEWLALGRIMTWLKKC